MKRFYLVLAIIILVIVSGCTKKEELDQPNDLDSKKNTLTEKGTKDIKQSPAYIYPLTGLASETEVDNRVIGVMVNNQAAARPQSGLSKADIVFEILAEGEITRFLALFQSEQPEVVGPVRSAREYYFELASSYDALYVYHGAANFVNDMIINRDIDHLNGAIYDNDGHLFKRESFRKAPHNSYLLFDAAYDVAETKGYDIMTSTEALPFIKKEDVVRSDEARSVSITYPGRKANDQVVYEYANGKYTRYDNQEQTIELHSEEVIELDNVFIIEAAHEVIDKAGRRAVDLESGGKAYLLQQGMIQELEWKNKAGKIIPVKEGKEVGFVEGKTWINVLPTTPGLKKAVHVSSD